MRRYLNPTQVTKREWLDDYAFKLNEPPHLHKISGFTAAVLVKNPGFEACALVPTEGDLRVFLNPRDERPKEWFLVPDAQTSQFT
jgi:hypothetical protein